MILKLWEHLEALQSSRRTSLAPLTTRLSDSFHVCDWWGNKFTIGDSEHLGIKISQIQKQRWFIQGF